MMLPLPHEAKFRCPRNLEATKEFSKCWRPHIHVVGVIVAGVVEAYFLLDPTLPSDSNMECTLIARAIQIAKELLASRGRPLPANLHVQADNTGREARNQSFMMFLASMIHKQVFRSVSLGFLPVGHTHIDIDQRFSIIATELAKQGVLQTPEDHGGMRRRGEEVDKKAEDGGWRGSG